MPFKIAFLHYHLKTGGVTTVLRQQVETLKGHCECLVLSGEPGPETFPCEVIHIPGLAYDTVSDISYKTSEVTSCILDALDSRWKRPCDLLHVHNPTLVKNRNLLSVLKMLQRSGIRIFLQAHDFAEDGRPQVYANEEYPEDCHWGVINSRDLSILLKSGLHRKGVHLISNAVTPVETDHRGKNSNRTVLYPVRALRRKNIGEAALLSIYLPGSDKVSVTRPPNSQPDIQSYNDWKSFVSTNRLKVTFDAGSRENFSTLVGNARSLLTTSITEGFGFAYLESWTAGKLVWGRLLPDICSDFKARGLQLLHFYNQVLVPLEWFDSKSFFDKYRQAFKSAISSFGVSFAPLSVSDALSVITGRGTIDFGLLDEKAQRQVISHAISDRTARQILIRNNPFLSKPGVVEGEQEIIKKNNTVVRTNYSIDKYRERILAIYESVIRVSVRHRIDREKLVKAFLVPANFSMLKWGSYDG